MRFRDFAGALTIAGLAAGPIAAQTPKADDSALKSRIETRLKANSSLADDDIKVELDHGIVTLSGTVDSAAQKSTAAKLAKVDGVTTVENKLDVESTVAGTTGKTVDKADNKAEKAIDKTGDAAKKVGEKTKEGAVEVGEVVTDSWITTALKADFVNEDTLKGSDINVDTHNHVVTLKGTVTSPAGRARANAIAKGTKGVSRVIDTLTIAPPK